MKLTRLQQSQISGSLSFNDQMMSLTGENRTLVDDLNSLRTQIKKIQGTDTWADSLNGSQDLADIYAAMRTDGDVATFQNDVYVADDSFVSGSLEVAEEVKFHGLINADYGQINMSSGVNINTSLSGNDSTPIFSVSGGDLYLENNKIRSSDDVVTITLSSTDVTVAGELTVGGDTIKASDTSVAISLSGADVVVEGNLTVGGNDIKASDDTVALTLSDVTGNVAVAGDLKVGGNEIKASDDTVALTLSDATGDVAVAGILKVGGDEIKASDDTVAISLSGADVTVAGEMFVDGGKITLTNGATIDSLSAGEMYLNEDLVRVSGDLQVDGSDIKSSTGETAITLTGKDVSMPGNLTVAGDIVVNGAMAVINTENLAVKDAIIGLGYVSGSEGPEESVAGDRGFVFSRGGNNVAAYWDETAEEFRLAFTAQDPDATAIEQSGWVNLHANNMVAEGNLTVEGNSIYGADGLNITLGAGGDVSLSGELTVGGDAIKASDGTTAISLSGADVVVEGNLKVDGDAIRASDGTTAISLSGADVVVEGILKVGGNEIKSSTDDVAITLDGENVEVEGSLAVGSNKIYGPGAQAFEFLAGNHVGEGWYDIQLGGDLQVGGNDIKSSTGETAITLAGKDVSMPGNLTVSGDFVVNGAMTVVNTAHLAVKDTIIALGYASGSEGPVEVPAEPGDRGFVFSRFGLDNVATFWDNADSKFKMVYTTSGPEATEISENGYANLHAGIVYSQAGFSGSLTKLVDGSDYLVAGVGISVAVNQNGSITISGASNSYNKGYLAGNSAHIDAGTGVVDFAGAGLGTLSSGANLDKNVDVYLNGALLAYGAGRDVTAISQTSVTLDTTLAGSLTPDDVITVVLRSLS